MLRYRPTRSNRLLDAALPLPERDWDADWRVRAPASLVLAGARILLRLPERQRAGSGTAVLGLYHLGDQLRMLNVLSRFSGDLPCLFTNSEALPPVALYENVGPVTTLPYHGLTSLFGHAPRRFERFLLPHPSMTMPSALCYARRSAARVAAVTTGEYRYAGAGVEFFAADRTNWRRFYESFFEHELGIAPAFASPQLLPSFRRRSNPDPHRVICHLSAGMAERSMPPEVAKGVLLTLSSAGFQPVLVGAERERDLLAGIAEGTQAALLVGLPLPAIAEEMSRAACFVGLESSMAQLADAVGVPAAVIYSATTPEVQGPFYTATRDIRVATGTITTVMALTGRLPKPRCDWSDLGARVARAVTDLLH